MHPKPHTFAMVLRTLRPTKGDIGATSIGLAAPFLMAADGGAAMNAIDMALAAAATAAAGMGVKMLAVGIAGGLRAFKRGTRKTKDEGDDMAGDVAGGIADALDPEHADPKTPPPKEPKA